MEPRRRQVTGAAVQPLRHFTALDVPSTGADTALGDDGTGMQNGITAFPKLKSPEKKRIGVVPTILLVPPELRFVAQRLYQSTTVDPGSGGTLDTANIHAGGSRPRCTG